ncbi:prolipoprotein diacylglyceryl transferase family protein [Sphingomonas sp. 3-13AW]|jgi:thiol-disulfide isomerase/thioredoxin|uniref:prolipoprotein diacylglyceryl transferase family protein n=1 Tax=Sphingomonas sp. 3-13AW TaxID=3050450 RepID=UPI003BB4C29A
MDNVIQIGPVMISTGRAIAIALLWGFISLGAFIGSRTSTRAGRAAWIAAGAGILAARIGFVITHSEAFMAEPWSILAMWQGGFSLWPGVVTAMLVTLFLLGLRRATLWMFGSIVALAAVQLAAESWLTPAPRPLPPGLVVADMEQRPLPIDSLRGRPLVVNLWATWCPPCRREMPMLIDVAKGSKTPILLVNQGEDIAQVRAYLQRSGLAEDSVRTDPLSNFAQRIGSRAMPTTLFIDASGRIVRTHAGEISRAALLAGLREVERASGR